MLAGTGVVHHSLISLIGLEDRLERAEPKWTLNPDHFLTVAKSEQPHAMNHHHLSSTYIRLTPTRNASTAQRIDHILIL